MSKTVHKDRVEAQANRNPKRSQEDISRATDQIDATLQKLREHTIPPQPYLLSVPSDVPYRHSSRFVNTWHIDTPFSADEEQLQYLSFLFPQSEEDSLLRVVGGWADEKGNLIEEESLSPASQSGPNTPIEQPSRKKISLKDYKTKDKTRPSTPTTKIHTPELRKQVMKSEARDAVRIEEGRKVVKPKEVSNLKIEKRDSPKVEKLPVDGARSPRPSTAPRRQDLPSPRKRRRLSTDSLRREEVPAKKEKTRENEDTKDLPLLLSPTLPAQQSGRAHKALPGLLLPNLPPALEKLVAKAEGRPRTESGSGSRAEPVKSTLSNSIGTVAGKRPPEKVSNDSSSNRIRSDSQTSVKAAAVTPKTQSPAIKPSLRTITRPVTPLQNGVVASPKPRQRHIIVLKYGKKNRKRVEALLKFASRSKKSKPTIEEPQTKPLERLKPTADDLPSKVPDSRPSSTKPIAELEKPDRKRPAEVSPERPVKKMKHLETPEKTKVNAASAIKSPANIPQATKSNPDLLTPKKELKSTAMRRIESQDGGDVRTPQGDRGRTSTPVHMTHSSQTKVSPGPSNLISKEERTGWQEMNTRCFTLGRTLKHEGTSLGPSPGNEKSAKDQALSVVLLIEALLCFMVNHAAQSQARPTVDPGWSTIMPYHIFVFRASRRYRHLHGLVIQLGAICRQAMHTYDLERLAREPLPVENYESAPTPGSDGVTRQNEDVEKLKKRYINFRDQLVLNSRELQSAWLEGSRYLPPTLIEREYPKTWAKRTKDTSKRGVERLKPESVGREYYLPLDINSTAFEATRFSISFLKEWSDKEKIDWKPRIEL